MQGVEHLRDRKESQVALHLYMDRSKKEPQLIGTVRDDIIPASVAQYVPGSQRGFHAAKRLTRADRMRNMANAPSNVKGQAE